MKLYSETKVILKDLYIYIYICIPRTACDKIV